MNQDDMKRAVAQAALKEITPGAILGVGTGLTLNPPIDLPANRRPALFLIPIRPRRRTRKANHRATALHQHATT